MSVDILGTVHVFTKIPLRLKSEWDCVAQLYHVFFVFLKEHCHFCTHIRGVPVTGK